MFAPSLAKVALKFGYVENFALAVLGLSSVVGLLRGNVIKGAIAAVIVEDARFRAGADQGDQDRGAECLQIVIVDLVFEASVSSRIGAGHATDLQS